MTQAAASLTQKLLGESPFEGFPSHQYAVDMQGWGYNSLLFSAAISAVQPEVIIEVGSWKGMSAMQMAQIVKSNELDAGIICVDTWLGSPEHIRTPERNRHTPSMARLWGYPQLYYTFMANVVSAGHQDVIVPYPATSENAAQIFSKSGLRADLIYIDAAHEYDPVKRDLTAYYDLLTPNGVLIGDDYQTWDGVTAAANEFARQKGIEIVGTRGKFLISKAGPVPGWAREICEANDQKIARRAEAVERNARVAAEAAVPQA